MINTTTEVWQELQTECRHAFACFVPRKRRDSDLTYPEPFSIGILEHRPVQSNFIPKTHWLYIPFSLAMNVLSVTTSFRRYFHDNKRIQALTITYTNEFSFWRENTESKLLAFFPSFKQSRHLQKARHFVWLQSLTNKSSVVVTWQTHVMGNPSFHFFPPF